jgi:ribosomal protein S27AE
MGDWFEVIADVEATAEEADRLAADMLAWLVERGIVMAEQTDCVLGGLGYAPGPNYTAAVTEPDANLHRLQTNGLNVVTGQTVFYSMGVDRIICPRCGAVVVDQDDELSWPRFSASIDDWYAGGSGIQTCERCGEAAGLNDWHWSPPWGFGYLGFEFWNWPRLNPDFIAEVSGRLGHRIVTPCGKL